MHNFLDPVPPPPQPELLTVNGSLFIGSNKGMMSRWIAAEGVHLLPAAR